MLCGALHAKCCRSLTSGTPSRAQWALAARCASSAHDSGCAGACERGSRGGGEGVGVVTYSSHRKRFSHESTLLGMCCLAHSIISRTTEHTAAHSPSLVCAQEDCDFAQPVRKPRVRLHWCDRCVCVQLEYTLDDGRGE
jgi:hypothetical protein